VSKTTRRNWGYGDGGDSLGVTQPETQKVLSTPTPSRVQSSVNSSTIKRKVGHGVGVATLALSTLNESGRRLNLSDAWNLKSNVNELAGEMTLELKNGRAGIRAVECGNLVGFGAVSFHGIEREPHGRSRGGSDWKGN
jgi:hypothetical protein